MHIDKQRAIMDWLAGPRATLILDGLALQHSPDVFGGAVVVYLQVIAGPFRTAELRRQWPRICWITACDERKLLDGFIPCEPTLPAILRAWSMWHRVRQSGTRQPELN